MTRRKPADQRQGRGTSDVGALVPFTGPIPPVPLTDAGEPLLETVRAEWELLWRTQVASSWDMGSDLPALERLFRLRDAAHRMMADALREPMVAGSQNQMVLNPKFRIAAELHRQILALEDRFGLTPSARFKLGIDIGGAAKAGKALEDINAEFEQQGDLPE